MSQFWIVLGVSFVSFVGMEAFAWCFHRYIMHGPLWFIHKTHHRPRHGLFELNDLFALLFAAIAAPLFYFGARGYPPLLGIALGMIGYGLAYFLVHDVLVHRRIGHRFTPARGYLRRVHQAHHMHHAVRERDGAVSFGFLMTPRPEKLAKKLRERAPQRSPAE
ncbi:sterol desaturase family protein [Dichotomicrobium thermohalophilum]|uniref:Beta-carotene 3-hydroxylase n=1 Tax=Dichotomicrobium thermohalophilum TaxID=933063 RepID=A0A397PFN4_9HYPH|nr:sterol desaturase family protein [Dichotomicrobium thermohalophilum]RIA47273.1 beta-carotene 3-hydroxylase [Dichotomicrobium thermohalophilum]